MADGSVRVAITVVAYESEGFIRQLLDRIPDEVCGSAPLILVSDDASSDATFDLAEQWAKDNSHRPVQVVRQPRNLGYGGNQMASFAWAVEEGADVVVLLHGDEQYPPELIPDLVEPLLSGDVAAVFGSRMMIRGGALRGGMPMVRFLGNRSLSVMLNLLARTRFTEWFSGFRAYRVPVLSSVGLAGLPEGFDFDTAITLRLLQSDHEVIEVPIPTRYGDEISRVPLLRVGLVTIRHGAGALLHRFARRAGRARRDRLAPAPEQV